MPEKKALTILWTDEALKNASLIKAYLEESFSEKEIGRFYSLLSAFERQFLSSQNFILKQTERLKSGEPY